MSIIGGVIHNNTAAWLIDEMYNQGIDLDYEAHCCYCPGKHGYHDECWCSFGNETILLGFKECSPDDPECWFREDGEFASFSYKPDEEAEFSAIVGEINTQVVRSKWVAKSKMCSPCYPGQGDLDSPAYYHHWGYWSYCLPIDLFEEEIYEFDTSRIKDAKQTWLWDAFYFVGAWAQSFIYRKE